MPKAPSAASASSVRALPGAIHQPRPRGCPEEEWREAAGGEQRQRDRIKITALAGPGEGQAARQHPAIFYSRQQA